MSDSPSDPFAAFQARRGRTIPTALGVLAVVVFSAVAVGLYANSRSADRLLLIVFGLAIAAVAWRYASIRAVPDRQGLVVRNLLVTRTVPWADVERVEYGGGTPWPSLHLNDGDVVAVMAIQRADGTFGDAEASRLAALVEALR